MKLHLGGTILLGIGVATLVSSAVVSIQGRNWEPSAAAVTATQTAAVSTPVAEEAAPATETAAPAEEAAPATEAFDFAGLVQPIFDNNCAMCHQGEYASVGLALDASATPESLIGVAATESDLALVAPGDPEASYLLHKIRGTQEEVGGGGMQMPLGSVLSDEDIATIESWISSLN